MTFCCLIHDVVPTAVRRDSKYTDVFDTVFTSEGINVIRTPVRAPNANSFAERWVRTLRGECLDQLLIINEAHLRRVLNEYLGYYNSRRPHQSLNQQSPIPRPQVQPYGRILKRQVLGGTIELRLPLSSDQTIPQRPLLWYRKQTTGLFALPACRKLAVSLLEKRSGPLFLLGHCVRK